ncbi:MAG: TatA/E family twin arginine-targeting protein translocase [Synechococcaceae cyanobacterium]
MNVFGIGLPEMAVIAAIALLVFGPKRLPELGRSLGRTLKGFQSASSEFEKEFRTALSTSEASGSVEGSSPALPAPAAEGAGSSAAPGPVSGEPPAA